MYISTTNPPEDDNFNHLGNVPFPFFYSFIYHGYDKKSMIESSNIQCNNSP